MLKNLNHYLSLVKFSHTLFALPFAIAAMFWAAKGLPNWLTAIEILLCMVFCRNAAMAFNRLIDADIDKKNPRTAQRHIPQGILSAQQVRLFFAINSLAFVIITYFINTLAFALAIPTLIAVCFYSLTKRFTMLCHFFLGMAISISPAGAWIAVTGTLTWEPVLLALSLLLWISGFDIIYATQDYEFDKKNDLHSLVVKFGPKLSLRLSLFLHAAMLIVLLILGQVGNLHWPFYLAWGLAFVLLTYLHAFRKSASLDNINKDFFLANIAVSFSLMMGIIASVFYSVGSK